MKRKLFKWLLTATAVAILSGGATPVGNAVYDVAGVETQVRADSTVSFDETTGTLTLRGNVVSSEVRAYRYNTSVNTVIAEPGTVLPEICSELFEYIYAKTIDLSNADTSNVTDMTSMFYGCYALNNLDISGFDTSKVTSMWAMFYGCSGLTQLDVSNLNTSEVTDMSSMFSGCSSLKAIDVSNFDTSKVTSMYAMFHGCQSLKTLDVSGFNTANVKTMRDMFSNCSKLTSLDLSTFDTTSLEETWSMFEYCSSLRTLNLGGFDTSNVVWMFNMFKGCSSIKKLDLSSFDTSNVQYMTYMFQDCQSLSKLDLSSFDTGNVLTMDHMFGGCSSLSTLDLSSFDTAKVFTMKCMFTGCSALGELDLHSFDTSNVTNMEFMFEGCNNLSKLDLSSFDTSKVTSMGYMFSNCKVLEALDLSSFDTSNVTDMEFMFDGCNSLKALDLKGFETKNVTEMSYMFNACTEMNALDISSFNTSKVTNMHHMFCFCKALETLDLSSFNTSNVEDMSYMFNACVKLGTITVSDCWNINKVTNGYAMFYNCSLLTGGNGTTYDSNHTDVTYARIDKEGEPGYLTAAVTSEVVITKQPRDWYGTIGKKASFSVEATGDDLSYEWQYRKSGEWFAYGVTSYDTANFSVSMNTKNIKWPVRCVIMDKYGQQAITREVWMKDSSVSAPITITKQPADWVGVYGKKATFTVEASGNGLIYQWQYRKGSKWTDYAVTGADTATLKVTMNEKNAQWPIRCKITDEDGFTATTNEVSMRLKSDEPDPQPVTEGPQITKQPSDWYGTIGKKGSFSVEATGSELSYQWQVRKATTWANYDVASATTANFQISMNEKTMKWAFRCVITDKDGKTATTNEVYLKLKGEEPAPAGITISGQPGDYTGKIGKKATFTVTATGEGLTYEWQVKKATTWSAYTLAGYDTPTFQVSISDKTAKWTYRCVIRDAAGNEVATNEVHIYVAE